MLIRRNHPLASLVVAAVSLSGPADTAAEIRFEQQQPRRLTGTWTGQGVVIRFDFYAPEEAAPAPQTPAQPAPPTVHGTVPAPSGPKPPSPAAPGPAVPKDDLGSVTLTSREGIVLIKREMKADGSYLSLSVMNGALTVSKQLDAQKREIAETKGTAEAWQAFMRRPEFKAIPVFARELGTDYKIVGWQYPAALPFYFLAERLAVMGDAPPGEPQGSLGNRPMGPKLGVADLIEAVLGCTEANAAACQDLRQDNCEGCKGMCGAGCDCWEWVCADCCCREGCLEHDEACTRCDFFHPWDCARCATGDVGVPLFKCNQCSAPCPQPISAQWIYSPDGRRNWTNLATSGKHLEELAFGDFDGDRKTDVFAIFGGRWRFSSAARGPWVDLAYSAAPLAHLRLGNFDDDPRTDVFTVSGNQWRYSSAGRTNWINLATSGVPLIELRFGDFDGDGKTDVFTVSASQWRYSSAGRTNWINIATSGVPLAELRFGDFDGDGKTDVFTVSGRQWRYSSGGRTNWIDIATSGVPLSRLRFADFDGDGKTDVFTAFGNQWRYSSAGRGNWVDLATSGAPLERLRFGDFDADRISDVFTVQ